MKTIEDKKEIVASIVEKLNSNNHFYVIDISTLNAADTSNLRRKCFEKQIVLLVVKNTLLKKALEQKGDFNQIYPTLKGTSSLMLCNTANVPAKLIKEIRGTGKQKPVLKAAYVEECIYVGDNTLESLAALKSRTELIGDVIGLLQSPMKTVLGQLQSGKNIIGGVVKTLQDRAQ